MKWDTGESARDPCDALTSLEGTEKLKLDKWDYKVDKGTILWGDSQQGKASSIAGINFDMKIQLWKDSHLIWQRVGWGQCELWNCCCTNVKDPGRCREAIYAKGKWGVSQKMAMCPGRLVLASRISWVPAHAQDIKLWEREDGMKIESP